MTRYEDFVQRGKMRYGGQFDTSQLNPKFIPHFNSGGRIEADIRGQAIRGTVGVTTGWRPAFLLLPRVDSSGSSIVIHMYDAPLKLVPMRKNRQL